LLSKRELCDSEDANLVKRKEVKIHRHEWSWY
jgi:hypothetical protein